MSANTASPIIDDGPLPDIPGIEWGKCLGRGGFATVFRARQHGRDDDVAVKLAHSADDPRMQREADILRALGRPLTPALFTHGQVPTRASGRRERSHYLIMEFIRGEPLAATLAARPRAEAPDLHRAAKKLAVLCTAVDRMHDAGVTHRDLKPDNVIFRDDDVVLIDFGLAKWASERVAVHDARLTQTGELLGTAYYMAPEQWEPNAIVDHRADLYALGVIAFEMFTGRPPFVGSPTAVRHAHATSACPRMSAIARLPTELDAVMTRALAKDREQRCQRAADLATAVQLALSDGLRPARRRKTATESIDKPHRTVLLGVQTQASTPEIEALARAEDAVLAQVEGPRHILAFPWHSSPFEAGRGALKLAAAIRETRHATGPALIHVGDLRVRRGRRRIKISGAAIRALQRQLAPDSLPGTSHDVFVTQSMRPYFGTDDLQPEPDRPLFKLSVPGSVTAPIRIDAERIPLRGRDPVIQRVLDAMRASRTDHQPLLATLSGDAGIGKTRVLDALARYIRQHERKRDVIYIRAGANDDPDDLLRALCRAALDAFEPTVARAHLDAIWAHMQAPPALAGRWGIALLLGAADRDAPELAPVLGAPGALRQAVSRALATVLQARADKRPIALLIDDAHKSDHTSLDALELITMAATSIDVVVAASPTLRQLRPRWADRALAPLAIDLPPLDAESTREMLMDLLRPAEFIPEPVLERLHQISGGIPLYLCELARAVRDSGALKQHRGMAGYYVAADELLRLTSTPLTERLATRALQSVPDFFRPLVEVCVLHPGGLTIDDIRGIQRALRDISDGDALLRVDASAGVHRLHRLGILTTAGLTRYNIRQPLLRQGFEAQIPRSRRRRLHAAALHHWRQIDATPRRIARHAAGAGAADIAAHAHLELAATAANAHRFVDAEEQYTQCIEYATDDRLRERALTGRGSMRYRLQRLHDALDDLRAARVLASARGDERAVVELLLEEATVLDWCQEWSKSAELAERAETKAHRLGVDGLIAGAELAMGRTYHRRDEHDKAIDCFHRAIANPAANAEIRIISLLMLACSLTYAHRLEEAETAFVEVKARCREAGDDFHLACVHINLQIYWIEHQDIDNALRDLHECIRLAQQIGNAQLERMATYNHAELLYWYGSFEQAWAMGVRAHDLQMRFFRAFKFPDETLLLARICCARGDKRVRDHLDWIEANCDLDALASIAAIMLDMVRLTASAMETGAIDANDWLALERRALDCSLQEERNEVVFTAVDVFHRYGSDESAREWLARARDVATDSTLWRPRLQMLEQRLQRRGGI